MGEEYNRYQGWLTWGGDGGIGEDEDARQGSHSVERDQGLGFGGQSGIAR